MSIQIYHDENTSFAMGQEEEGSWIKEDSIQAGGDEGMLGEYFNPTQSLNQSFQLPQWALEEPINQSSSSSPKPQVGEKRSRRRYRSNSTSSNSSISNFSEGSIDSLPSLTDSQTSVSSLESGSEDEEERGWLSWVRRQGQEDGHWNGKSSGNGAIKGDVIERIGIGMGMGRENEKMSHMRKKRCSRKIGGNSSTSEDEDSSSNDSITSSPDETFKIDSTITSSSPSTITSESSEEKGAINHELVLPLSEPERPRVEFQPLPSNNNVKDSNSNGRTNGSRSNFVDKLVGECQNEVAKTKEIGWKSQLGRAGASCVGGSGNSRSAEPKRLCYFSNWSSHDFVEEKREEGPDS